MEFPLIMVLAIYAIVLVGFGIGSVMNLLHVLRFGMSDHPNHAVVLLYVVFVAFVLVAVALYLQPVDWGQSFSFAVPSLPLQ